MPLLRKTAMVALVFSGSRSQGSVAVRQVERARSGSATTDGLAKDVETEMMGDQMEEVYRRSM